MKIRTSLILISAAFGILAGGCFTGIESTPRITADNIKSSDKKLSAEDLLMQSIKIEPPRSWQQGKRFYVADGRIGRIFTPAENEDKDRCGSIMQFVRTDSSASLTGEKALTIVLSDTHGEHRYKLPATESQRFDTLSALDIPFAIDLDAIATVDSLLRGKHLFVRTPQWYSPSGNREATHGLRHVEVCIDSVCPGTAQFPAAVCFSTVNDNRPGMMLMSIRNGKGDSRPFANLFSFDNPRKKYPEIKDNVWALIIASRVQEGMSRDECRLALGQPDQITRTPSYSGMREHWRYSDGMYLVFDDGYLSVFRL